MAYRTPRSDQTWEACKLRQQKWGRWGGRGAGQRKLVKTNNNRISVRIGQHCWFQGNTSCVRGAIPKKEIAWEEWKVSWSKLNIYKIKNSLTHSPFRLNNTSCAIMEFAYIEATIKASEQRHPDMKTVDLSHQPLTEGHPCESLDVLCKLMFRGYAKAWRVLKRE